MSDDWKVGDLALCVDDGLRDHLQWIVHVRRGAIYRVTDIGPTPMNNSGAIVLWLEGVYSVSGDPAFYMADRFRKIRPDEHEDCEPEFVELLNRIKRKVSA